MSPPAGSLHEPAVLGSLDGLLQALELDPVGDDRFRAGSAPGQFPGRIFGGQLLAQALAAASATAPGTTVQSLHAAFVEAGVPEHPIDIEVERVRDGRSSATRRVTLLQGGRPLLEALASFRAGTVTADAALPPVAGSGSGVPGGPDGSITDPGRPEDLPSIQEWAQKVPAGPGAASRSWIERPPAVEIRMGEPPTFLGGAPAQGSRSHWMRLPRAVGDDPALHAALLAYASDYFLMDIVFRSYPDLAAVGRLGGFSLDHALWLHRPCRFDRWHVHTQDALAVSGGRGLARGTIRDENGQLVATVVQDVLVRPAVTQEGRAS
ncbi:acyl-CoA thioesterase-2 [Parafrankia irregularis]|uniref:Acyl-CoA thioesterase-2 n=1 Tax=Parafrankia irregularis TaxID=795642 RepID=A0A0S4QJR1_9ACTN|nr:MULTISPECIES: acyl-CoA thioesterase domain-containing protein [Parafrankia]MBE3200845.1 thioesterase family protein [Parafrankia sp. CH37]CUU54762.1 acyl-CoA thioesterase-2 [Parafrankia irregularis]